jgi:hypothetical protein
MSEIVPGELLNEVKKLLAAGWCQGAYCRSGLGREVSLQSPWGKCWCPSGAVWTAAKRLGIRDKRHPAVLRAFAVLIELCREQDYKNFEHELTDWNDAPERTQAQVLALLDTAIRRVSPFVVMVEKPKERQDPEKDSL